MSSFRVDLNSDVGEGYGAWPGGPDTELMAVVTSANIACGFHAGDPSIMRSACESAVAHRVTVGAQVGYPDLAGFGRRFIDMRPSELTDAVIYQIGALDAFALLAGTRVRYVKPHGALYNAIVHHQAQAQAVVEAIRQFDPVLPLLGIRGSVIDEAANDAGLTFVAEGFADRGYTDDGWLIPRGERGSLITDPDEVAEHAVRLVAGGVQSVCVHSDTPGAARLAGVVRRALDVAGYELAAFRDL